MVGISHNRGVPAHTKIDHAEGVIRDLIYRGEAGDQLPRESDIATLAGVSRVTVREGLTRLWLEGEIVRRWGVGTFIADTAKGAPEESAFRSIYSAIHGITSLPREIMRAGHEVAIIGFQIDREEAPEWVRAAMRNDDPIWRVRRCLTIDGRPGVVMFDYLRDGGDDGMIQPTALADVDVDLMSFLRRYGLRIVKHESALSAVTGDDAVTGLLELPTQTSLLRARQQAISDSGATVGCGEFFYNDEVFQTVLVRTIND